MSNTEQKIVNPYGQYFSGDGIEIEMATFTEKNESGLHDVLLKITGAPAEQAGIDQQVIRYVASPAGTGFDLQFEKDGSWRTRMLSRNSWGVWTFFEVFLNGKTLRVQADETKAKEIRPLHLLTAYRESTQKTA